MPDDLFAVARPADGGGRVARALPAIQERLAALGIGFRLATVDHPADATALIRDELAAGRRRILVLGGDRLTRAAVAGMLGEGGGPNGGADLAVIGAGADNDFARAFGLPSDPADAAAHVARGEVYPLDVIAVTATRGGEVRREFMANMSEVGFGAAVARRAGRLGWLGPARDLAAFWATMAVYRPALVRLTGQHRRFEGRAYNVVLANGPFLRRGVMVSPRSWPGDGVLDVLVMRGPKSEAFTTLPQMFRGEHLPSPTIQEIRAQRVEVDADRPLPVHLDGEWVGWTPATFELLRGAIRLRV